MEEKLDFSLPDKKRRNSTVGNKAAILLLLILVALGLANHFGVSSYRDSAPQGRARGLSADQTKELAAKLARRSLHGRAAKVWQDYLAGADLGEAERARALFQAGVSLEKAGLCAEAIEYYYRSETAAALGDLVPQINAHIKSCFEKLGKFSALRYELMDRTVIGDSQQAGAKVVAEIGAEKITAADLDALIENAIEDQLNPMSAFMTAEQFNGEKAKMLEQYKNPQAKQQFLQNWLAQEILYRQALAEQLAEKPKVKSLLDALSRGLLSQQLINAQLASKINITETDLQTYYTANKDKYIDPAKAGISHILVDDEQQAKDLIKKIKDGEDFAGLAKAHSKDDVTKDNQGKIDVDVIEGSAVPVIGDANGLAQAIFAAQPPAVLDEPFKTEAGWEIVKVDTKHVERQMTFDEVRQQVRMTLTNQKRQDVQQDYIKQMMDKYGVIIHTSVLAPSNQAPPEQPPGGPQK